MRDTFVATLSQLAAGNSNIMLLTGDLGFGVFDAFRADFPDQYLNVGVAEQNMAGIAAGLAQEGKIVFTYSIGNFVSLRCLEQLRNDCAYHALNVNAVCIGGGFSYGALGMSHHATEDLAVMRALPEITVISPGDRYETQQATAALIKKPGTGYLRLDKTYWQGSCPASSFELGRARVVREGDDVTIVTCGGVLREVIGAADALEMEGIRCRVLSMHTLSHIDVDSLVAASIQTGGIVTVEEHVVRGGLGGAVAEELLEAGARPKHFARIGIRGGYCSVVGSQDYLRTKYGLDKNGIAASVRTLVSNKTIGLSVGF